MKKIRGFTIIELLIVVCIVGILSVIAIAAIREKKQRTQQTAPVVVESDMEIKKLEARINVLQHLLKEQRECKPEDAHSPSLEQYIVEPVEDYPNDDYPKLQ